MKPYTNLYPQICSWENLETAYYRARQGKRGKAPAASFERKLEDNLVALQEELLNGTYRPGAYHSFYIHEPKRRLISAAPFRDRVVHHALCNVIEPLFERRFIFDSYANRVGIRRTPSAKARIALSTGRRISPAAILTPCNWTWCNSSPAWITRCCVINSSASSATRKRCGCVRRSSPAVWACRAKNTAWSIFPATTLRQAQGKVSLPWIARAACLSAT